MDARICVLGVDMKHAIHLLDLLCEANADDIFRRRKDVAIMNDGTELIARSIQDKWGFVGQRFDYVFYDEDDLTYFCVRHGEALEEMRRYMGHSSVPSEFQWCGVKTYD